MSSYLLPYTVGAASFTNGSKTVTGVLTAWTDNVKPGDLLEAPDGRLYAISASTITNTALELIDNYAGSTEAERPYKIHRVSPGWGSTSDVNVRVADLLNSLKRLTLTSVSELTIGTGEQVFTVQSGFPISAGARVVAANPGAPENFMAGLVTEYAGTSLTVDVDSVGGSGTFAEWNLNFSGVTGLQGQSGDDGVDGSDGADGSDGWSPVFAIATDGERRVLQVGSWAGGDGVPPASGGYVGASGLVPDIEDAIDIRGPAGSGTGTVTSVSAGAGLTGGPITEVGTLSVDIVGQTEETEPADIDVFLMQLADGSGFRKVKAENLPGSGSGDIGADALMFDTRVQGLIMAGLNGEALFFGPDGSALHDSYEATTYVDLASSSNIDTGTPGKITTVTPSTSPIIQDMSNNTTPSPQVASAKSTFAYGGGGAAWNAFDQNNATGWLNVESGSPDFPTWLKIDMGTGVEVGSFTVRSRDTNSVTYNGFPTDFELQGSDNDADWTTVHSETGLSWSNAETKTFNLASSATYRYWRWYITDASTDPALIAEAQLFPPATPDDATLVSKGILADAVPATMRCAAALTTDGTINTDVIMSVSRDDGVTWSAVTLTDKYEQSDGYTIYDTGNVDVSGQPSGSTLRYRIVTDNGATLDVDGVAMWGDA